MEPYSRKQRLDILAAQGLEDAAFAADHLGGEGAFLLLETQDFLFDAVAGDQLVDEDGPCLADAMGAVGGLRLDGGVPPRINVDHVVGGGQVQADAARLQADQKEGQLGRVLEAVNLALAVGG